MLIPVLIILNLSFLIQNSNSQWVQTNIEMTNGVYAGSMLNVGNNIYAGIWNKGVFYTSNNGINWEDITNNTYTSVFTIAGNKNYLFAGDYGSGASAPIYRSSDFGQTWINVGNNIPYPLVSKIFTKGDSVLVSVWEFKENNLFESALYFSTDNGNIWNNSEIYNAVSGFVSAGTNVFAATGYGVYISSDYINWISVNNDLTDTLLTSIASDEHNNILYVGTLSHGVFSSTNNGSNWIPKNTGIASYGINSLRVQGNNIIAGTDHGVYVSSNFGSNWLSVGLSNMSVKSFACNDDYIFASTMYNSIWRRPISEIIGIQNISTEIPKEFMLFQNYPNPFNPATTIKFQIPSEVKSKTSDVKLIVYNILGSEVATLVYEQLAPGNYSINWNASAFPSGVYFYKLTTDGFIETKKMMMIK